MHRHSWALLFPMKFSKGRGVLHVLPLLTPGVYQLLNRRPGPQEPKKDEKVFWNFIHGGILMWQELIMSMVFILIIKTLQGNNPQPFTHKDKF